MGIRIHKFLGYGLTDVQSENYRLTDPRINADSPLLSYGEGSFADQGADEQLDAYAAWLLDNSCETSEWDGKHHCMSFDLGCIRHREEEKARYRRHRDLGDCCVWMPEYGLSNVLVLQPWGCADWQRYDDSIDYIEETYLRRPDSSHPQIDHVQPLRHGIYPWTTYMDKRTGEKVNPNNAMPWIRVTSMMRTDPDYAQTVTPEELVLLAKVAGFDSHEAAVENMVPRVPGEIRDLARYGNLFTSDDVWLQLRPMLYTYWS